MKKMLLLSAALLAVLAGPAMAQRDNGRGDGPRATQGQQFNGNRGGDRGDRGNATRGPQTQQQAAPQAAPRPQVQQAQRDNGQRDFNRGRNDNRQDFNRGGNDNRPGFRGGNDNRFDGRNNFGRNDRFDNNRGYDNRRYSQYYRNWNSPNRFRAGAYYRPNGFTYRRWSFGDILPSLFWGSRYQLSNYYAYDLPPPPPGTVWVRYGDDALLIDRYSGEVIQVSYSVFW